MGDYNVLLSLWNKAKQAYDNFYPITLAQNVFAKDGKSVEEKLGLYAPASSLAKVAASGSYNDLSDKPAAYAHPTTDGNLHVPATATSNSGKVLKAGNTAGSLSWGTLAASDAGAAPASHTSTNTTYGAADGATYGHVRYPTAGTTSDLAQAALPFTYKGAAATYDLNDYRTAGIWTLYNLATDSANFPDGWATGTSGACILEVIPFYSNTYVRQMLHKRSANEIWIRYSTSATAWGAWRKMSPDSFAECSTAAGTAAKTATLAGFTLTHGSMVTVKFTNTNSAGSPTLNINSTGAKAIYAKENRIGTGYQYLQANGIYTFVYNSSLDYYELIVDDSKAPNNHASTATTYGAASDTEYGHVLLATAAPSALGTAAVGTSARAARQNHVHAMPTASDVGAAPTSHGNHVPATQAASNKKFLRNDNTWQDVTPANISAAPTAHASTATTYGAASDTEYGHVLLATAAPSALGTAAVGTSARAARQNHVHAMPTASDVGAAPTAHASTGTTYGAASDTEYGHVLLSNAAPSALGTAAVGTSIRAARQNHVHAMPTASDIGAAPTAHASTATTYGVSSVSNYGHAMASSATPLVAGTAAVGTDNGKFAREGHVHPLQTTLGGYTAAQLLTSGNAALLTGSVNVSSGSSTTLPLPSGFTETQCKFFWSLANSNAGVNTLGITRTATNADTTQRTIYYIVIGVK